MERNFETVMLEQCSPVLAGLKAARLNKCTAVYLRLFNSGTPIFRLAVAA